MVIPFPGGIGLSGLQVYDWPTHDGVCGGSPHVHLTCSECYVVIDGSGRVQTLSHQGFAEVPLKAGTVAWFTPGTIHRLVNDDDLRIVVVMQNNGLPEAGDAVFTFPTGTLADPEAYAKAASLADPDHAYASDEAAARRRRDLAIEGFLELRRRVESGDHEALDDFYRAAARLKRDRLADWEQRWRSGALAVAQRTGEHLDRLRAEDISHLKEADIRVLPPQSAQRLGMCGRLDVHAPGSGVSPHD
ncbi:cupin domain-containing protein [Kibdelosporangium persicum]|uniref:Mannose-6-phosphate isomerase n=1 Tax=Kibdelosporangium persicum TaxID=2698649 RepID=A0ABX2F2W1_9PSEU|nr:cupin domain-containing protein [Kibdelosporangium persicum]NRN65553.1 Mannose-6-phosphate isomerase [Kibdelosporangium persicum]